MAEDKNIPWEALGEVDDSITILEGLLWEKFAPGQVANVGRVDYRVKGTIDDADFTAAELKVQSALKSFGVKLDSEGIPKDIPNTPSGQKRAL